MPQPHVLVIEAGLGNIGSVCAALERLGVANTCHREPPPVDASASLSHLLLPGVGSFQAGMAALESQGWDLWIKSSWLPSGRPLLGICLGMQLLATSGSEGSSTGSPIGGLDLIPGHVSPLQVGPDLVLPHVGWNSVNWQQADLPLAAGFPDGGDVYFVHSFAFSPAHSEHALALCDYGGMFTAVVGDPSRNIWGMQFHPEKSQKLGRRLLENFLALGPC